MANKKTVDLEDPVIFIKKSSKAGPSTIVMVGVHGNEHVGPMIFDWIKSIEPSYGKIISIFANPTAYKQNQRFINVNLNRRFGLENTEFPEDKIVKTLESYMKDADFLLDIHMYNEKIDKPFVIANKFAIDIAKQMPIDIIVTGWEKLSYGASDDQMSKFGKPAIGLECGSLYRPEEYQSLAKKCVTGFLVAVGNMKKDKKRKYANQIRIEVDRCELKKSDDFIFNKNYDSFDALKEGDIFASQNNEKYVAQAGEYIIFPRQQSPIGAEVFTIAKIK